MPLPLHNLFYANIGFRGRCQCLTRVNSRFFLFRIVVQNSLFVASNELAQID